MNIKKLIIYILPFALLATAFSIHYHLIIDTLREIYSLHSPKIQAELLKDEYNLFYMNTIGNSTVFILQIIGAIFILNIGLLFYEYNYHFMDLVELVLKSSIVLVAIYYLIIPVFLIFYKDYHFDVLYKIESEFTLYHFLPETKPLWLLNLSEIFSVTQLFFVAVLVINFKKMMNWTFKTSLFFTVKVYGMGFSLWAIFSSFMDLNFYK